MGCEGGVYIFKIKDIEKNWKQVKKEILLGLAQIYQYKNEDYDYPDKDTIQKYYSEIEALPDKIESFIDEVFNLYYKISEGRDTPYILDNTYLITSTGDNVPWIHDSIGHCVLVVLRDSIYLETWT